MNATHAVIELHAQALRYVALREGDPLTLERLGSFSFEFDCGDALQRSEEADTLDILQEAVEAAFGDTPLTTVQVILHPPLAHTFFVPVPSSAVEETRARHLRQEAGLLLGASSGRGPVHVESTRAYRVVQQTKDTSLDWLHAIALRQEVYDHLQIIGEGLRGPIQLCPAGCGVAHLLAMAEADAEVTAPHVAFGWYPSHLECVVTRPDGGYFAHHLDAAPPADAGFLASTLVRRLQLDQARLGRPQLFGAVENAEAFDTLRVAFGRPPEPLDPLMILDLPDTDTSPDFNRALYAPALGLAARAALGDPVTAGE